MSLTARIFELPKSDSSRAESEDRHSFVPENGFCSVIDGASRSLDARGWGEALRAATILRGALAPHGGRIWMSYLGALKTYDPPVLDAQFAGLGSGQVSGAALSTAALQIEQGVATWEFEAVGDVGILLMRADGICQGRESLQLGNHSSSPDLLLSETDVQPHIAQMTPVTAAVGDRVLLFSDGIGDWLTSACTLALIETLEGMSDTQFERLVLSERSHQRMPDDDVTLAILKLEP